MLCFRRFLVAKSLWIRGRGKYEDFLSKNFCLTVPKIFVGEPFSVSLISSIENIYALEGYVTIFCRKYFASQNRKTLHGNHSVLCFGKFPVTNNFTDEKRVVSNSYVEFFLSHTVENCRRGTF